ncbi:MAG: MFS transporter, partial [Stackebrandtia sp.]
VVFTLVSEVAVASVPAERAGSAVGVSETSFELGNALGLALLGSLAALMFRSAGDFADTLGETIARHADDPALIHAAQTSFVTGLHAAVAAGAVLLLLMAVAVMALSRRNTAAEQTQPASVTLH